MARIFQLEFFVKELIVWNLPTGCEECDENCIEVTVFGHKNVPICGLVFGKNSTLNRGQNFLFTLNATPSDEENVSFVIFKKSFNGEKKNLGSGRIPIEKIFEDIFVKTFTETKDVETSEKHESPESPVENSPIEQKNKNEESGSLQYPISKLSKDLHPIIGEDSKQCGSICILLRITSFGDYATNPIHLHQNQNQRSHPDQRNFTSVNEKDNKKYCNYHHPMNKTTGLEEGGIEDNTNMDLCPCPPPGSEISDAYEEFMAEINDNALCIRLPRNAGVVQRVYRNNNKVLKNALGDREYASDNHLRSIPVIRGNQKYPAHYGIMSECPKSPKEKYQQAVVNTMDSNLQCTEELILNNDNCPSDVQIFRKNCDSKRDVFLLKIGKQRGPGKQNEIQVEMKTPKHPYDQKRSKQSQSAQTEEEEFAGKKTGKKDGDTKPKKGKKGGK